MNPRYAFALKLLGAFLLIALLAALFLPVREFLEEAARKLRYLWWLVFLLMIAIWLIWGLGRKKK